MIPHDVFVRPIGRGIGRRRRGSLGPRSFGRGGLGGRGGYGFALGCSGRFGFLFGFGLAGGFAEFLELIEGLMEFTVKGGLAAPDDLDVIDHLKSSFFELQPE